MEAYQLLKFLPPFNSLCQPPTLVLLCPIPFRLRLLHLLAQTRYLLLMPLTTPDFASPLKLLLTLLLLLCRVMQRLLALLAHLSLWSPDCTFTPAEAICGHITFADRSGSRICSQKFGGRPSDISIFGVRFFFLSTPLPLLCS